MNYGFLSSLLEPSVEEVWQKARYQDPDNEALGFRKDRFGNWIKKSQYGNRNSQYGWEKDHYPVPRSLGGSNTLNNLEPVQWEANVRISNLGWLSALAMRPLSPFAPLSGFDAARESYRRLSGY